MPAFGRRSLLSTATAASIGSMIQATDLSLSGDGQKDERETLERSADDPDESAAGGHDERGESTKGGERDDEPADAATAVEFLDRETVRITGSFDDVVLSLFWWDERGLIGTISESVGEVEGERTISAPDEFGEFAIGPIVSGVDLFESGSPVVPGGGDLAAVNPDVESCVESIREEYGDRVDLEEPFPEPSDGTGG